MPVGPPDRAVLTSCSMQVRPIHACGSSTAHSLQVLFFLTLRSITLLAAGVLFVVCVRHYSQQAFGDVRVRSPLHGVVDPLPASSHSPSTLAAPCCHSSRHSTQRTTRGRCWARNLSIKKADGSWTTDTSRLLLMDCKDFNRLGIAIDDLIEAYVQTVLATLAIDRMACRLTHDSSSGSGSGDGQFDRSLYASLNNDHSLLGEIMQ